jgi:hypothetical protein
MDLLKVMADAASASVQMRVEPKTKDMAVESSSS